MFTQRISKPSSWYSNSSLAMLTTMSRPPAARAKALAAYAQILGTAGERAATLDAVAETAGISKGGLLYHFGSREELITGLADHLRELIAEDIRAMTSDPQGPTAYLLRTSAQFDTDFEGIYIAVAALAQSGHEAAVSVLQEADRAWFEAVLAEVGDAAVARAVVLLSDGIYAHAAIQQGPTGHDVDELRALIDQLVTTRRDVE